MLKSILRAFAYGYGRTLGRQAAQATSWVAIPLLVLVVLLGISELMGYNLFPSQRLAEDLASLWRFLLSER